MTTATAPSLLDSLLRLKVDNAASIKGEIILPDEKDKKAGKALASIKDKYEHRLHEIAGQQIFRLKDEGKMAVVFVCKCGALSLARTSDLWQRMTCTTCIGAARKARRDEKKAVRKAKQDAQKSKATKKAGKAKPIAPTAQELKGMKKADLVAASEENRPTPRGRDGLHGGHGEAGEEAGGGGGAATATLAWAEGGEGGPRRLNAGFRGAQNT